MNRATSNVLEYLEHSAERYPDKTAFEDEKKTSTYRETWEAARRIGGALAGMSEARRPIPVLGEKSVETVQTFFGIVNAGCFYILLDPKQPVSRLQQILKTLDATLLVVMSEDHRKTADALGFDGKIVYYEQMKDSE